MIQCSHCDAIGEAHSALTAYGAVQHIKDEHPWRWDNLIAVREQLTALEDSLAERGGQKIAREMHRWYMRTGDPTPIQFLRVLARYQREIVGFIMPRISTYN